MVDTIALSILSVTEIVKTALISITVIAVVAIFVKHAKVKQKTECGCEFCHTQDKHEVNKEVK